MLKNYFKIALRKLLKDKRYSLINILGLSVGMTAFILITLLLQYEYSFDKFHKNYERIYRVQQEVANDLSPEWTRTPYPVTRELKTTLPEIEQSAVIREIWGEYLSHDNNSVFQEDEGFFAEEEIFRIFSFNFLEGSSENALDGPGKVILTKSLATKLFSGEKSINRVIKGSFTKDLIVSAVIEDFPENSHFRPSYLVSFETADRVFNKDFRQNWRDNSFKNYILLKATADPEIVNTKIKKILGEKLEENKDKKTLYLKPLKDIHLKATREDSISSPLPYYAAVALFILILACINFINLTTARSGLREKEIGVRKVVGGGRNSLIIQFLGESVLVSMFSMLVAFLLVEVYLPIFNSYMKTNLSLLNLQNWKYIIFIIFCFILTGVGSGIYPAFYLSSLKPISVLKGYTSKTHGKLNKGNLRKFLVTFQFIISISLILTTLFIFKQVNFMKNKDLGFNKSNLLRCFIKNNESKIDFERIRTQLLTDPSIIDASLSENTPFNGFWSTEINWEGSNENEKINAKYNEVDYNFINTFEMKIVKGRNFSKEFSTDDKACIINETMAAALGWENPVGKRIWNNKYLVIGVVKDFHPYSIHLKIPPYFMTLNADKYMADNDFCVRVKTGNILHSMEFFKNTLKTFFPDKLFEVKYFDDDLDKGTMVVWTGVQNTFSFFSTLTVVIAMVGLLGLVSFTIQRRTKEIGIRKILGSSISSIYFLVVREFIYLLVISIFISVPIAYIILNTAPGAYKVQLSAGDFIIPLCLIIFAAILSTISQILKVATKNPISSLRYE